MPIAEELVAAVVAEAGTRMSDPEYAPALIGDFVQRQPNATRYLSAHEKELGGAEAVVNAVFHSALLLSCFKRAGQHPRTLSFPDLDFAAQTGEAALRALQPALNAFLAANVASEQSRKVLTVIAIALSQSV